MKHKITGMKGFGLIWGGQVASLFGTSMTGFALTIWAWLATGQATALALVGFFSFAPTIIFSPVAGALVDRWNRKHMMLLSDLSAGMATLTVLILYSTGNLQIWHLYILGAITGIFQAFQWPAYSAAVTTMLTKDNYARAQGMISMAEAISAIGAPILAASLLGFIGISGIMCIDLATMVLAVSLLLMVHIPQPAVTEDGKNGKGSLWKEMKYGFTYISERKSLLYLLTFFLISNLVGQFANVLFSPMVLSKTGNDQFALATVITCFGIGGIAGGLTLTAWGGPKNRIRGMVAATVLASIVGWCAFAVAGSLAIWCVAAFIAAFVSPFIMGASQSIWQSKVAPDVQGRVFSTRRMIAHACIPISMLIAGPLADVVMEPAMGQGGWLAPSFGWLVGVGPGAGMALIVFFVGVISAVIALAAYAVKPIRDIEKILPDHVSDAPEKKPSGEGAAGAARASGKGGGAMSRTAAAPRKV